MILAARQSMWNTGNGGFQPIVDPDTCKAYIQRTVQSQDACFTIDRPKFYVKYPITVQYIIDILADASRDKKCFEITDTHPESGYYDAFGIHIISGGWRTNFQGQNGVNYAVAGGSYDSRKMNVPVSAGKHNWVIDGINGIATVDGNRIQDVSTISVPDQKYYAWGTHNNRTFPATVPYDRIQLLGMQGHYWGNLWHKFYRLSFFDADMKPVFIFLPYTDGNKAGLIDIVTGETYTTPSLTGSFIYGEDA